MNSPPYLSSDLIRHGGPVVGRAGVGSYPRERDFPRATRYTSGAGYNLRGYDTPYDDLTLAERRELEEIRLQTQYARPGVMTTISGGSGIVRGRTYPTSRRLGAGMHPASMYSPGVRTVGPAIMSGPVIHNDLIYSDRPADYLYDDYRSDPRRLHAQDVILSTGGGSRARRYPTTYNNRRMFDAPLGYENRYGQRIVEVGGGLSRKRYY